MSTANQPPAFTDQQIKSLVAQYYGLDGQITALPSYLDLNRKLSLPSGRQLVIKVANSEQDKQQIEFENLVMSQLTQDSNLSINTPKLQQTLSAEDHIISQDTKQNSCIIRLISFLDGQLWAEAKISEPKQYLATCHSLGQALAEIDLQLANLNHPASHSYLEWDIRHAAQVIRRYQAAIERPEQQSLINNSLQQFEAKVMPLFAKLPMQIIHNDANDYNLLVAPEKSQVTGLFDFGDMIYSFRIAELAIAAAYAIMQRQETQDIISKLCLAYHQTNPLTSDEIDVLLPMIQARLAVSVCKSSHQYHLNPENEYLLVSQKGAWQALEQLSNIDQLSFTIQLKNQAGLLDNKYNKQQMIDYRQRYLSKSLSLAYEQPLKIVAGQGAHLYDEQGNKYLDMVNNVCHVGHCHPDVVAAGQQQMAMLNTNTRYLHDNIIQFSKKLLATMPDELSVCFFVNSGSEANELALRLARSHNQRQSVVCVEHAYHGNTGACVEVSPYKFMGPGGKGAASWVKTTLAPDPFRGKYRANQTKVAEQYAQDVKRALDELAAEQQPIGAFICESIQGVGGQIINPTNYLKLAYQYVRQAGGICIADEVQVGMGRVGSQWWAFQTQDVIPDIVTIGKPLGNGHPLAAVVTSQAIADSFVNGMEFFNTFGGNPVSCAIGNAVFEVIERENLLQRAATVGKYIQDGLKMLQNQFPIIGNVRGLGMFIGAEFICDSQSLEPATEQINYVINRLKDKQILLTTEGPLHNVLKIKPPLAFSKQDADYFLTSLAEILSEPKAQI